MLFIPDQFQLCLFVTIYLVTWYLCVWICVIGCVKLIDTTLYIFHANKKYLTCVRMYAWVLSSEVFYRDELVFRNKLIAVSSWINVCYKWINCENWKGSWNGCNCIWSICILCICPFVTGREKIIFLFLSSMSSIVKCLRVREYVKPTNL